jgi:hypothetical protein
MSVSDEVISTAVGVALNAAHAALDELLHHDQKAEALDLLAERAKFDAAGQRKLDAHRRQMEGQKP